MVENLRPNTKLGTNASNGTKFAFSVMLICIDLIRNNPTTSIVFVLAFLFVRCGDNFHQRIWYFYQILRRALHKRDWKGKKK